MVSIRSTHTDLEWMELVNNCRTSGLTDADWCAQNGISRSRFYYHVRKLRDAACPIPASTKKAVTDQVQEVVPLVIQDDPAITPAIPMNVGSPDNSAVRIQFQRFSVEISNTASAETIRNTLSALGALC